MSNKEDIDQVQDDAEVLDRKEFKRKDTMTLETHAQPAEVIAEVEAEHPNPKNVDLLAESQVTEIEEEAPL